MIQIDNIEKAINTYERKLTNLIILFLLSSE